MIAVITCLSSPFVYNNFLDSGQGLQCAAWEGLQPRVDEVELLEVLAHPDEGVVGDVPDGRVPDHELDDVVGPEDVSIQSLHVAVGDGQVGNLDLGRRPQTHRHARYSRGVMQLYLLMFEKWVLMRPFASLY